MHKIRSKKCPSLDKIESALASPASDFKKSCASVTNTILKCCEKKRKGSKMFHKLHNI